MSFKSIRNFDSKIYDVLTELGYSKGTLNKNLAVARKIIAMHNKQNKGTLDKDIVERYICEQEQRFKNGKIGRKTRNQQRKSAIYFMQIFEDGTIVNQRYKKPVNLPGNFCEYLSAIDDNGNWSVKHRKTQREFAIRFFSWLCHRKCYDSNCIDEKILQEYLSWCAALMSGSGLDSTRRSLKQLLLLVFNVTSLPHAINKLFMLKIPIDKKIHPFMPQDEIAAVLNVINLSTSIGKRDYAMILLGAVTGLRGIDIIELEMESIDWRNGEIKIVQSKTEVTLALPLTSEVGSAIRDYIENARPKTSTNKLFVSTTIPFSDMSRRSIGKRLNEYCKKSGLTTLWGFHSLRRSIATNMVMSGVSVMTVAQTLGHQSINSTKQYISLDSLNLKKCALDFSGIEIKGAAYEKFCK
jgi:integrase/recombinase XerD